VVGEGLSTLSGGQRQRVLIARALVGNPRIVLFDEATSALDNISQATVLQGLAALEATRIVIAHRLNTVRNADRIVVLERGRIVQEGTFAQLAGEAGPFSAMLARQVA
jgi:ABC-type bacteriocin/lantibiotic exporter with double-glycine peptidase domain